MLLSDAQEHGEYTVVRCGDVSEKVSAKLASLGIVTGQRISVLSSTYAGLIVEVKGSRLAVGKSLARELVVT
ncbi:MAG: FeoA family protein [Actinomycetota bacterium]|nr:FeoA family protein [Actinomycetota bacterium]